MNRKTVYLLFCILGVVLPYSQFVPWVLGNGLHMKIFFQELFANRIGGFFGMDVLVSAVVLIFFLLREGKRLGVRHLWLPIAGVLTVGVSLGLPLFLYLREQALEGIGDAAGAATAPKTGSSAIRIAVASDARLLFADSG